MKITIDSSIALYSAIRKVSALSKLDDDRIYLLPQNGFLEIFCGNVSTAIAKTSIPATISGEGFPFWISLPRLSSFLGVVNGGDSVNMSIVKKVSITCGVQKLVLPVESDYNNEVSIPDDGETIAKLTPSQFKELAMVSDVAREDRTSVFSGVHFSSDGEWIRTIATDGYGVGYAWQPIKSSFHGDFIVPALLFSLLLSKTWEEDISVILAGNSVVFKSLSISIMAIQMSGKSEFPAKLIVDYLSSETMNPVSVELDDLSSKLTACSTIKYQAYKKTSTVARVDFNYDSESFRIETRENDERMSLNVLAKYLPKNPVEFTLNGSFALTAIKVLSKLESNYVIIGEASAYNNWVTFRGENASMIFGFAKMIKDYA